MGAIGGPEYNAVADVLERIDADVGSRALLAWGPPLTFTIYVREIANY